MKAKPRVKRILMTHAEAAEMVGIPKHKLLRWAKGRHGGFPAPSKIVERTYLFNRADVEAWCLSGGVKRVVTEAE